MPGVRRLDLEALVKECGEIAALGIPAVAIFPCIAAELKDERGTHGFADDNVLYEALRRIKKACPSLLVIADVALDPYTSHGHDGLLGKGVMAHVLTLR